MLKQRDAMQQTLAVAVWCDLSSGVDTMNVFKQMTCSSFPFLLMGNG